MQIQQIVESGDVVVGLEVRDASRFSDFEQQLNENPQIRSFTITNGDAGLSVVECIALLQHLATLENLTALSLNVDELMSEDQNAGQALALLLSLNKLQDLELYGDVSDSKTFFEPVHGALRRNASLKHFGVYCQNFGDGIYSDLARIISAKGLQKFKITLDGFDEDPIDELIGIDELMGSVANIRNSTEVHVIAMRYLNHTIAAYNTIMPEQAVKKKLQQRVRENYLSDLHAIVPSIDNYLMALPEVLFGNIMTYIPGLQTVLRIIYPECKTGLALLQQLVSDIHRVRSEILWANTMREQVLGHHTIRTGLYFDAIRRMRATVSEATVDVNSTQRRESTSTQIVKYTM
jgi:hypothetical protein